MVFIILDNIKMDKKKEMVYKFGIKEIYMKDNGLMEKQIIKEELYLVKQVIYMKATLKIMKWMEKEDISIEKDFMMVNLKMGNKKEKD